jgi:PhnB protein
VNLLDCDAVAAAALANGATLDRGPESSDHGRTATFHDPFGHRWMINSWGPGVASELLRA